MVYVRDNSRYNHNIQSMQPCKEVFDQVKDSIRHEEQSMLVLFTLEKDYLRIKMTGYDLGYPRKMFRSKFRYQQLPEKVRKHVGSVEELFELLRSRDNFNPFKMAGIITLIFHKGQEHEEKVVLKLRRELLWHEIADRYIEKPAEEQDPELMKTEKILREDGTLARITTYYDF